MRVIPEAEWILHPSDFANEEELAFAHALRIAVSAHCGIGILNAVPDAAPASAWGGFPGVRKTLEKWGLLPSGSLQADVPDKLGVQVKKVIVEDGRPARAIERYLDHHEAALLVLSTEGRAGLPRWLKPSVAEDVARHARLPALFVPKNARGFVSPATGALTLRRVLLPIDHTPPAAPAFEALERFLGLLGMESVSVQTLHVVEGNAQPIPALPTVPGMNIDRLTRQGLPVEEILEVAETERADLIVMATAGVHGILDVLRGSTSEQVLRRAPCPVMTVPSAAG